LQVTICKVLDSVEPNMLNRMNLYQLNIIDYIFAFQPYERNARLLYIENDLNCFRRLIFIAFLVPKLKI